MFNRTKLKDFAQIRLKQGRGTAILVSFLAALLAGTGSGNSFQMDFQDLQKALEDQVSMDALSNIIGFLAGIMAAAAGIGLLYTIFVGNIIALGNKGWFLRYWRGELPTTGELFSSFRIYKPALTTMLVKNIYTFLWSLLFVIPGIVKAYSYSMTEYILYENPNLSANEAITLSRKLTDGSKGDLFIFDLSFLGWNLLNVFTFGLLGIFYTQPYYNTAHAAVYQALKDAAIAGQRLRWEDFGQVPPAPPAEEAQAAENPEMI